MAISSWGTPSTDTETNNEFHKLSHNALNVLKSNRLRILLENAFSGFISAFPVKTAFFAEIRLRRRFVVTICEISNLICQQALRKPRDSVMKQFHENPCGGRETVV